MRYGRRLAVYVEKCMMSLVEILIKPSSSDDRQRRPTEQESADDGTHNLAILIVHDEFPILEGFEAIVSDQGLSSSLLRLRHSPLGHVLAGDLHQ